MTTCFDTLPFILCDYSREQDETVRTILVRDGTHFEETIEIRRVFVHPGFKFPSLYDDIAVAELGKKIEI